MVLRSRVVHCRAIIQWLSVLDLQRRSGLRLDSRECNSGGRCQPAVHNTTGESHFKIRASRILHDPRVQYHSRQMIGALNCPAT
jgi:hypothetical protein